MKILYNTKIASLLKSPSYLFFDTSSLNLIIQYEKQFVDLLKTLNDSSIAFTTIPSVYFEFSRTDDFNVFIKRKSFFQSILRVYPIETHYQEYKHLIPILHKIKKTASYTDFLLYCCLYKFSNSYLITENHRDFTTSLLDREQIITVDGDGEQIRNTAIYSFNKDKYEKIAEHILKHSKTDLDAL